MSCAVDLRFRVKVSQRSDSKLNKLPYQLVGPENHAKVSVAASINVCRIPSASLQADSVPTVKSALVDASRSRQPRPAPRVSRGWSQGVLLPHSGVRTVPVKRSGRLEKGAEDLPSLSIRDASRPHTKTSKCANRPKRDWPSERARASGDYTAHRHCRN